MTELSETLIFGPGHEKGVHRHLEQKLTLLRQFNELLVESSGDCILVVDGDGLVLSINRTGRRLLEIPLDENAAGRHWAGMFQALETKAHFTDARIPRAASTFQAMSRTKAGEQKFWNITFTALEPGSVEADRYVVIARDVTEHMLVEKALRQSEEAFRKLFEENPIGIVLADLDLTVAKVNNAFCAMLGFSEKELVGRKLSDPHFSPRGWPADEMDRLMRGVVRSFHREVIFQTKRKHPVWGHVTTSLLRDAENIPFQVFQMLENIQDRKSSEEQVLAYQVQLQSLASELSLGEERERRRIATNLHDLIGQSLAFARLKLAGMERENGLAEVKQLIEQAIADTRSLTFELSPPVLYELGLVAGLEWLARKIQQDHNIQTRFHDDGQPKPLHENFRIVLFQAVRELLVNVVKHAHATHAQVLVRRDSDALRIIIEDDGTGFEISKVSAKVEAVRSFGLFNIRERVEYLGGQVKIRSEAGRGTRVTLIAPLKVEKADSETNERTNRNRR